MKDSLKQRFCSYEYDQEFKDYVQNLSEVMVIENNKKIDKFVKSIESLIERDSIKVLIPS